MSAIYKGHEGEITKGGSTVAYVSSFSVENAPNLDPVFEMGSRNVQTYAKGNEEITGSFDKLYANTTFLDDIDDQSAITYKFEGIVTTAAGGSLTITLSEVTLTGWSWDLPEDDFVTESVDFQASALSTA